MITNISEQHNYCRPEKYFSSLVIMFLLENQVLIQCSEHLMILPSNLVNSQFIFVFIRIYIVLLMISLLCQICSDNSRDERPGEL